MLQLLCRLRMRRCMSYIDDLTTVSYNVNYSRGECFVPLHPADDGPVGPETRESFVN